MSELEKVTRNGGANEDVEFEIDLMEVLLRLLEKWMDGSDSYELVQDDQLVMSAGTYSHPDRGTPFDERSREFRKNGKGGR